MYWNSVERLTTMVCRWLIETWDVLKRFLIGMSAPSSTWLIETWDVLKLIYASFNAVSLLINRNMRCIETTHKCVLCPCRKGLIETWDVLKPSTQPIRISVFRLIETWDVLKLNINGKNMPIPPRLIETWDVLKRVSKIYRKFICRWLIETWDVLKQQ